MRTMISPNRSWPHRPSAGVRPNGQEGSLFIMVLLVLLILTAVALSLMFVTEIEMQMGGSERVITQTFYAAESGLHAALAGLQNQNWNGEELTFVEGSVGHNRQIGTRVVTSNVELVGAPQLPPMTLANEGENQYFSYSVFLRSAAQRVTWPEGDPVPFYPEGSTKENLVTIQSERRLAVQYVVSPLRQPDSARDPYENAADRLDPAP